MSISAVQWHFIMSKVSLILDKNPKPINPKNPKKHTHSLKQIITQSESNALCCHTTPSGVVIEIPNEIRQADNFMVNVCKTN